MAPADHRDLVDNGDHNDADDGDRPHRAGEAPSHWVRWHRSYEDPASPMSLRLRIVQAMVRSALDSVPDTDSGPIRVVSICAGQGRDVIDVLETHPRTPLVSALLVELDPALAAFARDRATDAGVSDHVQVVEGDAAWCGWYVEHVPAHLVLLCGIFGNVERSDVTRSIEAMRALCAPGGHVVWTRHRQPPDATPSIRADFAAAGFAEVAFEAPEGTMISVGLQRLEGPGRPFEPDEVLFEFVGDGRFCA